MGMQNPGFSRWDQRSPPPPSPRSTRPAATSGVGGIITHRNYSPIRPSRSASSSAPLAASPTASLAASNAPLPPRATSSPFPAPLTPTAPQFEDSWEEDENDYSKSNVKQLERKVASSVRGIQRLKSEIWSLEKQKLKEQKRKGGKEKRKVRWRSTERSDSDSCSSSSGEHPRFCTCWRCKRPRY